MRRLVGLVAAACMLFAGLVTVPVPAGATVTRTAGIDWGACSAANLVQLHAECGFLAVPLDYSRPHGPTIRLAVSRVRHTSPGAEYQGVMLVNPGGPGGSGLGLASLGQFVPGHVGDRYDWIGFDPRGVGASTPALSCDPNYFHGNRPPYVPVTRALVGTWLARSKSYARACGRAAPALLPHLKTTDSVRDLERIRVALGARQLNYYGFSYGTYLGQVYATLFPSRVRRMVLDSNVDPRRIWYRANLDQDVAFDRNIRTWFAWVARYESVYHLGGTPAAVQQLFHAEEAALTGHAADGVLGPDEWADAFVTAGYAQSAWRQLADAFSTWVHQHDAKKLIAAYESADSPGDDNGYAVYNAVQCTDVQWPRDWSTWARDNWRTHRKAPFYTWGNAWFNAPCLYWPARAGTPVRVNGHHVAALLVGETLDAATPFTGSLEVRRRFPASSLIAEPGGTTHANTLAGNACVDDQIAAYLAAGALPPRRSGNRADASCAPLAVPVPATTSTASVRRVPLLRP